MKWDNIRLGDVATFVNGYPFKPTEWEEKGLEIIRIQNLTRSGSECNYFSGDLPDKYKVIKGDILISWSATLDIFVWNGNDAWLNQHIFKVVFDKIDIDKNYFIYSIKHVLDDMRRQVHGATMQHITKGKFDEILIPLPPLPIQKRIAEILDAADALRKKDQELLMKYDELAQAIFIDMFGDPVKNEKGWEVKKLGDALSNIQIGPFGTQLHESDYVNGGVPVVNPMHIKKLKIHTNPKYSISLEKYNSLKEYHLHKGDVILGRRGEMGRCALVNEEKLLICGTGSLFMTTQQSILNPLFLTYLISQKSNVIALENCSAGTTMPNLNKGIINDFPIIIPPIALQNDFEKSILGCQKGLSIARDEIVKSNKLFEIIVDMAFSGELVS